LWIYYWWFLSSRALMALHDGVAAGSNTAGRHDSSSRFAHTKIDDLANISEWHRVCHFFHAFRFFSWRIYSVRRLLGGRERYGREYL
jgi:hypothetical protein